MYESAIFLDTCALLYLSSGSDKLSSHALSLIDSAKVVFVSPISAWEICLKTIRGHLKLSMSPEDWFSKIIEHHFLEIYPLSTEILMKSNRLPWHHRDPADRFIISSTLEAKAILISTDEKLRAYDVELVC